MTTQLDDRQITACARQLLESERTGAPVAELAATPPDLASGYRVQDATHALVDEALVAWKAGCTSLAAQQMLGMDAPVAGRYRQRHVLASPAILSMSDFVTAPHLEVEFGLRLTSDVDAAPADALDLADAVEVFAAIELIAGRLAAFPMIGGPLLAADNVVAARMVVGATLDLDAAGIRGLDTVPVSLYVDGVEVAAGSGADALGHPLTVLAWLADHAATRDAPLRAGDLVITGTCTGLVAAVPDVVLRGQVGGAAVELSIAAA